jgi:hypothetical protein
MGTHAGFTEKALPEALGADAGGGDNAYPGDDHPPLLALVV